jgi:hypothetical protein
MYYYDYWCVGITGNSGNYNLRSLGMENQIILFKNNDKRTDSDVEKIDEFYEFLQGDIPESIRLRRGHKPKLTSKQAWSVIWYLQEHLSIFPEHIEKCSNCGQVYDCYTEGIYWQSKGKFFCSACDHLVPENYDNNIR